MSIKNIIYTNYYEQYSEIDTYYVALLLDFFVKALYVSRLSPVYVNRIIGSLFLKSNL